MKSNYDILYKELQELKDLFFLGKKNWFKLLVGKLFEMDKAKLIDSKLEDNILQYLKPVTYNNYQITNFGIIGTLIQGENV